MGERDRREDDDVMYDDHLTLATLHSERTVYSANVLVPIKWKIVDPSRLRVKRLVPSGMTPLPWVERMAGQRLVLGDTQKMHSGLAHCGV